MGWGRPKFSHGVINQCIPGHHRSVTLTLPKPYSASGTLYADQGFHQENFFFRTLVFIIGTIPYILTIFTTGHW